MAIKYPLSIARGKTLSLIIRWEDERPIVSRAITAISIDSGFPRLTVPLHGVPNGWRGYVTSVQGMKQINAKNPTSPRWNPENTNDSDFHEATVLDANTIEFNGLNPVDDNGRDWPAYSTGGFFKYRTPIDLSNKTIRAKIKDKVGGKVLLSTELSDAPLNLMTATIDNSTKTILIEIVPTVTEAITWNKGVWEVEGADSTTGKVNPIVLPDSPVSVTDEIVTP